MRMLLRASPPANPLCAARGADGSGLGGGAQVETGSDHLAGLGDDAFWNGTLGAVFVQRGARAFSLTFNSLANLTSHPAAIKTSMVDLATKVLTRF